MPICPRPRPLFPLGPPFIWREASRPGLSGVAPSIFNSHPFFCLSSTPEAGQLVAFWVLCHFGGLPLSLAGSHLAVALLLEGTSWRQPRS